MPGSQEGNFSQAGRGVLTQSVRPTICDVEEEEQENNAWWDRWHKPFNPEEESTKEEKEQSEREEEAAGDETEEEHEEAQKAKAIKAPSKPSKEEVDEHMVTHLPFRSWCPHCVRGKSKGKPHRKATQVNREIPTLAMDYMFMNDAQNEGEEKGMPILVAKDINQGGTGTGMIFARGATKGSATICSQNPGEHCGTIGPPRAHPKK